MSLVRLPGTLAGLVVLAVGSASGQRAEEVPTQRLAAPDATFPEPFSSIVGLRELDDGSLLVSDRLESAIKHIDFASGEVREVGRVGQGPGEFRTPGELFPLPGDSTLLVDFGNMRMTVIAPDGSLAMASANLMRPDGFFLRPAATDGKGRVYFDMEGVVAMRGRDGPPELADSAAVGRWDRATGAIDTVGALVNYRQGGATMKLSGGGASLSFSGGPGPFSPTDAWDVAADGRVAIARAGTYHLEWRGPDGGVTAGPVVDVEPVPVTREDKEAWAERLSGATVSIVRSSGGGEGSGGAMKLPRPDIDEMEWPEVKPPFPRGAVSVVPEGEVWVRRHVPRDALQTFDVFDATGRRVRQVTLPEGRLVVGFGRGVVYAVRIDADDLQWLERYRR